jgi:acyl transferase domain-containing protein/acyl carrier protein
MSDTSDDTASLSPLKRALLAVKEMRAKIDSTERDRTEPIAIVGLGCRIPGGASDPASLWRLLRDGTDAITETPEDRWDPAAVDDPDPETPGKVTTRWGGYLDEIGHFDPYFFGISPREAACMDPQQRLLLEVAYEALENAGQPLEELSRSATGVFMSLMSNDYAFLQFSDPSRLGMYTGTGSTHSIAAGRLSFLLDLCGPSLVVDTACSSSLVAVHLACQSLRNRECDLALAGGANVVLSPTFTIIASKMNMLARNGRCKTFDASADGFVRGEGCGVVALRRLSDALAREDRIWAIIRGSAVNHDGRTNGLTAPNGRSQEELLRKALHNARLTPEKVGYIEAHGTGTSLGDPVEMEALAEVYGKADSSGRPCPVGAIKTNVGHLEAAAGVAGLLKAVLSLTHEAIVPNLHFRELNPHIKLEGSRFTIPTELLAWPASAEPRRAGVSSFGWSGTNCHVIIEEPPPTPALDPQERAGEPLLLTLSARSSQALRALAGAYQELVTPREPAVPFSLADVCRAAALRRSHHDHRLSIVARTNEQAVGGLAAFLENQAHPGVAFGAKISERKHKIAFIFPGQGSQWPGMGARLLEREPVFRDTIARCEEAMRSHVDWSLARELTAHEGQSRLSEIDVVQPLLFAMQVALAALWRSWGVEPTAVVGHSMGEIAAAHVAGTLSLEDAARIICQRSRILKRVSGLGAMAVVELSLEQATEAIVSFEDRLSIAVSNSPRSTVLSGEPAALAHVLSKLQAMDVFCRPVKVTVASHSPQMDPLESDLLRALAGIAPRASSIPIYSTVTGKPGDGHDFTADYWVKNLRKPVLFSQAITQLAEDGHDVYLESSAHPVLLPAVEQGLRHLGRTAAVLPSLRREEDERGVLLESLGALYCLGEKVSFRGLYPSRRRWVDLPSYPFAHERFWIDRDSAVKDAQVGPQRGAASVGSHSLLGRRLDAWATQPESLAWESTLALQQPSYIAEHRVQGAAAMPGAAYVEMALAAVAEAFGDDPVVLSSIEFQRMLFLSEDSAQTVQFILSPGSAGDTSFAIHSRRGGEEEEAFTAHALGVIRRDPGGGAPRSLPPSARDAFCAAAREIAAKDVYRMLRDRGVELGPRFQGLDRVWRHDDEVITSLRLKEPVELELSHHRFHPIALDLGLQSLSVFSLDSAASELLVPAGIGHVRVYGRPTQRMWCRARRGPTSRRAGAFEGDIWMFDEEGNLLVEALGISLRLLDERPGRPAPEITSLFHGIAWRPQAHPEASAPPQPSGPSRWLIFADEGGTAGALAARLEAQGEVCTMVLRGPTYAELGGDRFQIDPTRLADLGRLLSSLRTSGGPALRGIVHLYSLDAPPAEALTLDMLRVARALCAGSVLALVQALEGESSAPAPRLWLVTRGVQPIGAVREIAIAQSPLWGLGQVIAVEHPELRCGRIDLDPNAAPGDAGALFEELWADSAEAQIAFRNRVRHVARLVRRSPEELAPLSPPSAAREALVPPEGQRFRLSIAAPGVLDRLTLRAFRKREPSAGYVEIEVQSAGLNFLDVLVAMGVYPDDLPEGPPQLGMECAGTITALGDGVRGLSVGQEVVCFAPGSFGSHVITKACLVVPRPEELRPEDAATLPVVFVTAHYALEHIGRLRKGERVLIHAASGGCGLAAIQIAKRIGAEIFATAGSPEKRALVRSLGVQNVMDSRTLDFAAEIHEITVGEGVDVIVNTLTGEAIAKGLSILRPFGRFLDISKRDIHENARLRLGAFKKSLSYSAINLSLMQESRPDLLGALLGSVMERVREGVYRPLPREVFPISRAAEAFHTMAQARHTGKIVLSLADPEARASVPAEALEVLRPDATYLITGGLGGLGLSVAQWMVASGARSILLVGRSDPGEAASRTIEDMRRAGAVVVVSKADVADAAELRAVLSGIDASMPALRGIIHAAAVLDDGTLRKQDRERFERVMPPKIDGAYNLHTLTEDRPLDFFVLFSSAVTLLGSAGQANYTAANAFLDALAHHRRARGLSALAINWGPWAEIGLAAAKANRGERLGDQGIGSITPLVGALVLGQLLRQKTAQIGVLPFDPQRWFEAHPESARSPLFAELDAETRAGARPEGAEESFRAALLEAPPGAPRRTLLEAHLRRQIAAVLRIAPARIDSRKPLGNLGFDSLTALELRNRLEHSLGVTLSATLIWSYPTMAAITAHLAQKMEIPLDPPADPEEGAGVLREAARTEGIDPCSEDEMALLLARELAEIRKSK